jgi:hypothetical protein
MDQMWREPKQMASLGAGLEDEVELSVLEIANAAVNQARGSARRAAREIVLLDERHGEAAQCCVARNAASRDAAADDEKVEPMARQLRELLVAPAQRVIHRMNSKPIGHAAVACRH